MERFPATPQRAQLPRSYELSPFDRFCISALSPLRSGFKTSSPVGRSLSPQILWPSEVEEPVCKQPLKNLVIKKLDFSEVSVEYEFKAHSVPVQVKLTTDDKEEIELPRIRPRKQIIFSATKKSACSCKRSKCLKLYCECFAANGYCNECNCKNCMNRPECEALRKEAYDSALEKNPLAFFNKRVKTENESARGCNCKNSACLKRYCECFKNKVKCSEICRCEGCKNVNLV